VNAAADVSESRLIELVRAAVGKQDLAVRIDGYSRWRATASIARRMREGRIFIAGDAAHLMPPNGGFGGNTGIHDAHNLAWKLALVMKGHAGLRLLDSYESERRPVAVFTVEQAFSRYVAPHLWLERHGVRISTIDLVGRYVLLAGAAGSAWAEAAKTLTRRSGEVPLDAYCIGRDLADLEQRFPTAYGVSDSGASLVRPDGFVAWNCRERVADPVTVLQGALNASLCSP
jgi:putative polyketide hydroxylase